MGDVGNLGDLGDFGDIAEQVGAQGTLDVVTKLDQLPQSFELEREVRQACLVGGGLDDVELEGTELAEIAHPGATGEAMQGIHREAVEGVER